jgi:hypothetical protein
MRRWIRGEVYLFLRQDAGGRVRCRGRSGMVRDEVASRDVGM